MEKKIPYAIYTEKVVKAFGGNDPIVELAEGNPFTKCNKVMVWAIRDISEFALLHSRDEYIDYRLVKCFKADVEEGQKIKVEVQLITPECIRVDKDYLKVDFYLGVRHDEKTKEQYYTWDGIVDVYKPALNIHLDMEKDVGRGLEHHGVIAALYEFLKEKKPDLEHIIDVANEHLEGENGNGDTAK